MTKTNRKITLYTLKKSTEHLYYEAMMFFETLVLLTKSKNQLEINILLDAFAIHTRNLFDFFYPKKYYKKDDMVATDFMMSRKLFNTQKTKKKELISIVRKTAKQVVHLTYARNRYSQKTKPWHFVDVSRKMHKTLNAFYNSLDESQANWPYIIKLKNIIDNNNALLR